MRGSLMRRWTKAEHTALLKKHMDNKEAAAVYTLAGRGTISPQLVRYWRSIFVENEGNMAGADRALASQRKYIKPELDDDLGEALSIPDKANRILVIPDMHAPYEHPDALAFLEAVRDRVKPDLVVNVGDELDYHALSFHDSDPNLDAAGAELERGKIVMRKLYSLFPTMLICHSNHGSMQYRRAKAHGIPVQMIKRYRDVVVPDTYGAPGWSWRYGWRIQTALGTVLFKHQSSGAVLQDAAHNNCNLVVGHQHGLFSVEYAASTDRLYWGMYVGCLIDKDALAFAYGKHSRNKPILGCGIVIDGVPALVPMLLNDQGRWVGAL